mgnify:CR=1 FL=1
MPDIDSINASPPFKTEAADPPYGFENAGIMEGYSGETYYGISPLKHSHYKWRTGTSFFLTGIAAGSQIISTLFDFFGSENDRSLVRTGRYVAMVGGGISPLLLISSLHTKQRWFNMLRILKKTSPMSIGIWSMTPFSLLSGISAGLHFATEKGYLKKGNKTAKAFAVPAALLGGLVITYMGTELEETQMPVWAKSFPLMAPFYAASGMTNATEILLLSAHFTGASPAALESLKKLAVVAGTAELALGLTIRSQLKDEPQKEFSTQSTSGLLSDFVFFGKGMALPLFLRLLSSAKNENGNRGLSAAA